MAVLDSVPGLVVTVQGNRHDLEEYEDEDDEPETPKSCVRYVESTAGARISLGVQFYRDLFPYRDEAVLLSLWVDNQGCCSAWYDTDQIANPKKWSEKHAISSSGGQLRKQAMYFADLSVADDPMNKDLLGKQKHLGTILAQFSRAKLEPRAAPNPHRPQSSTNDGLKSIVKDHQISEKNLKGQAISHQASFGDVAPHATPRKKAVPIGKPFAVYTFKYRSKAALQALAIIPRSPSPEPVERSDRSDIDNMTEPELREALRQLRDAEVQVKKEKLKRERPDSDDSDSDDVEFIRSQPKRSKQDPGTQEEVVEISDDE